MAKVERGKEGWAILLDGGRPYVDVLFPSEAIAKYEREELLRHFPQNHLWRARLSVDWWSTLPKPKPEGCKSHFADGDIGCPPAACHARLVPPRSLS
jgi:hypothetical protein